MDNLLSNAALYSPAGARIRVRTLRLDGRPTLVVENTGVQIGAEALPRLFEPFYREEQSRNRRTGGSGLGLYLVKMILDRARGPVRDREYHRRRAGPCDFSAGNGQLIPSAPGRTCHINSIPPG